MIGDAEIYSQKTPTLAIAARMGDPHLKFGLAEGTPTFVAIGGLVGVKHTHYVSEFYLEPFADVHFGFQRPSLWRFERGTIQPKLLTPSNLAVQTHYYSVRNSQGVKDDLMEHFLGKIESDTAPILRRIAAGSIDISRED